MFAPQMNSLKYIFLGIGTNMGHKPSNISTAYQFIQTKIGTIRRQSKIYQTPPWGFESDQDFFNTVVKVQTQLTAKEVLTEIKMIEKEMGRSQKLKIGYSSRIIDIDIIDYNGELLNDPILTIPHSHCHKRNFVLYPLKEIEPFWTHPTILKTVNNLIENQKFDSKISIVNV